MKTPRTIKKICTVMLLFALVLTSFVFPMQKVQARTITSNDMGTHGGYDYEFWRDSGTGTMVLKDGGAFSCQWSNINNILFRKGRKFDETKTHKQIGNIVINYGADYNPNGNSYLCIYGWTVDPLVEYYIVESWGSWRPPGAQSKGKITVDGGTYDIYETTRVQQPSIKGTATFQQYWSVRTSKKTSGTVSVTKHFEEWERMGMKMGKMYEVATTVEGYQSSGSADVHTNKIVIGGSLPDPTTPPTTPPTSQPNVKYGDLDGDGVVNSMDASLLSRYILEILTSIPKVDAADLNGDGIINSTDATLLSRYILEVIDKFPVESMQPTPPPTVPPTIPPTPPAGSGETTVPTDNISVPSFSQLKSNQKLPDPFTFIDGSKVTSMNDWALRRAEISALAQKYVYGEKPSAPESVTGSVGNGRITVTVKDKGKTISFDCTIQYPSKGKAPYPAMIGMGMNTLNTSVIRDMGVALITLPVDEIAQQSGMHTRGKGKFYDLYGSGHSAGALMAWAWGASRLIDALEVTPSANIDAAKIAVTGGSRYGKGALAAGAFDERIALTIPQESGCGGTSSWRVAEAQKSSGQNVQTLSHIITEQPWLSKSIDQFVNQTNKLPVDQHMILGMCAPRGLLVVENTGMEWLGNVSCYTSSQAARMIYESLGVKDNMGFSQIGGHMHCAFPDAQIPELRAFIQKFLLDDNSANTSINKTDGNFSFDRARWVDWSAPTLR